MIFLLKNNLAIEFDALGGILEQDYKYQWTLQDANNNRFTMLNTDIEVAYDIDVDNFGEGTSCEVVVGFMEDDVNTACICPTIPDSNYCSASDTFELVQTYANVSSPLTNLLIYVILRLKILTSGCYDYQVEINIHRKLCLCRMKKRFWRTSKLHTN